MARHEFLKFHPFGSLAGSRLLGMVRSAAKLLVFVTFGQNKGIYSDDATLIADFLRSVGAATELLRVVWISSCPKLTGCRLCGKSRLTRI
jgi:hypothetical protein